MTLPLGPPPYAAGLLQQYLRDALPDATIATQWTGAAFSGRPYVLITVTGGAGESGMDTRPTAEIETYTGGDQRDGDRLAWSVQEALFTAWRAGKTYPEGWISSFTPVTDPVAQRLAGQPPDVHRHTATYRFVLRPNR
ncbi:hypothetical protein [Sciscionella sediminilitoris]|uniref:hypothetical protein n=1 Tax=Sciscionella sediminilitoris TaxID=1445613 RepID=UPI0004DF845B|nr:hypothetical protein [Sciscionella sp. SE31]